MIISFIAGVAVASFGHWLDDHGWFRLRETDDLPPVAGTWTNGEWNDPNPGRNYNDRPTDEPTIHHPNCPLRGMDSPAEESVLMGFCKCCPGDIAHYNTYSCPTCPIRVFKWTDGRICNAEYSGEYPFSKPLSHACSEHPIQFNCACERCDSHFCP